ncbi:MAG: hypothetical protein IJ501_02505 [Bacilli bacterium]|nr:hypothetical protein [Bacilli bacterium]
MEEYLINLKKYQDNKTKLLNDLSSILTTIGLSTLNINYNDYSVLITIVMSYYLIQRIKDLGLKKYYLNLFKEDLEKLNDKEIVK